MIKTLFFTAILSLAFTINAKASTGSPMIGLDVVNAAVTKAADKDRLYVWEATTKDGTIKGRAYSFEEAQKMLLAAVGNKVSSSKIIQSGPLN